jgi:hypothetical protein
MKSTGERQAHQVTVTSSQLIAHNVWHKTRGTKAISDISPPEGGLGDKVNHLRLLLKWMASAARRVEDAAIHVLVILLVVMLLGYVFL